MSDENPWGPDWIYGLKDDIGETFAQMQPQTGRGQVSSPYLLEKAEGPSNYTEAETDIDVEAGKRAAADYWQNKLAERQEDLAYRPEVYNAAVGELDKYQSKYEQLLGGPQGLSAQVEGAYGAAAARGREGAQNIYQEGQRAAGAIDALYGGAAARAEGLAAGQGLGPTTALSGFTPVSGEMAYMPTVGRAYGATAADYTGAGAALSARDLAASGSGQGQRRMSLDDWAKSEMLGIRMRLDLAHATAQGAAKSAQERAAQENARAKAADEFTGTQAEDLYKWMENFWENGGGKGDPIHKAVLESYGRDKEKFLAAVKARLEINSKRAYQQYWMQYTNQSSIPPIFMPTTLPGLGL